MSSRPVALKQAEGSKLVPVFPQDVGSKTDWSFSLSLAKKQVGLSLDKLSILSFHWRRNKLVSAWTSCRFCLSTGGKTSWSEFGRAVDSVFPLGNGSKAGWSELGQGLHSVFHWQENKLVSKCGQSFHSVFHWQQNKLV